MSDLEHIGGILDSVLVGFIARADPAVRDVTDEWCESPRWREAARALCRHRDTGGRLGDIVAAGEVLEVAGIYLPHTTAAEAACAAFEAVPAQYVVERARDRLWRLRLHRLSRLLEVTSQADAGALPRIVDLARRALDELAS